MTSVAYLGPPGTFTEEALLGEADLADATLLPLPSLDEVLDVVERGRADLGFVPLENSIEGTVNAIVDSLVLDHDLLIQREAVLDVHLHLLARPDTHLGDVRRVVSFPHATAQCRKFLASELPGVELEASNSTADAAAQLGRSGRRGVAAIAPALSAKLYGLSVLASAIEDHSGNQTRFVALANAGIPRPTGHDRSTVACFQHADRPGSLHAIIGQFAARGINLTKLESRPTKRSLGDYFFVIDLEGHIADEVVGDCLRDLHAELARVKFLGSYPAAGAHGPARRRSKAAAWQAADSWLSSIRGQIRSPG